jgi:glycosidase
VTGAGRSAGIATPNSFYGGTIKGVTRHLDYIAGLGCTAIWLSPVFENNPGAYHGYNTNNYLARCRRPSGRILSSTMSRSGPS